MTDYQLYIADDRHGVATLRLVEAETDVRAIGIAADVLRRGEGHHTGAELWRDDRLIASVGQPATLPSASRPS